MKNLFKLYGLTLIFLSTFNFFIIGIIVASIAGVAKGQGLAGGAIVFMYGVFISIGAMIISIILGKSYNKLLIVKINKIQVIVFVLLLLYVSIRIITREPSKKQHLDTPARPKSSAPVEQNASMNIFEGIFQHGSSVTNQLGIGFFKPEFTSKKILLR